MKAFRGLQLTGKQFHRLKALKPVEISTKRQRLWLCQCTCGKLKVIEATKLVNGYVKSCGCLAVENCRRVGLTQAPRTIHEAIGAFWKAVDKPLVGCWIWKTAKHGEYPKFMFRAKRWRASRFSYFLAHGFVPNKDLDVLHKCDEPRCVRPSHLFLGEDFDNQQDAKRKGRRAPHHGILSPTAKLNDAKVLIIREAYKFGDTVKTLTQRFNVSDQCIVAVLKRKTWTHI